MGRSYRQTLRLLLSLFLSTGVVVSATNCPQDQYPYTCSTCLRILSGAPLEFDAAQESCQRGGGDLITIEDEVEFETLVRYLASVNESSQLWIGYRCSMQGGQVVVTTGGEEAPQVLQNSENFAGGLREAECVGIEGERFFTAPCTEPLGYVCAYSYQAPVLTAPAGGVVYVAESQSTTLEVWFEGLGVTSVEWRHNGTQVVPVIGIEMTIDGDFTRASLTIQDFNPSFHLGTYLFVVENPAGMAGLATWQLWSAVLEEFTLEPQDLSVPVNQIAFFQCEAGDARSRPQITWFKNSSSLDVTDERFQVSNVTGTLFIRNVTSSDSGVYHCTAENGVGTITSLQATLTVITHTMFNTEIMLSPRNATVLVGESYSLECVGRQSIRPQSWTAFWSGESQSTIFTYMYPSDSGFPMYTVTNVSFADESDCYFCQFGPFPVGPGITHIFSHKSALTVHSLPNVVQLSTLVNGTRTTTSLQSIPVGSSLILECQFTGVPIPSTVVWTVGGTAVSSNVNITTTEGGVSTLEIPVFQQSGVYQCEATNVYGSDNAAVVLCGTALPDSILFFTVADSNTSLYVNWTVPLPPSSCVPSLHPLLLRYELLFREAQSEVFNSSGLLPANPTEHVISDLGANTTYEVAVVAYSPLGMGSFPPAIAVATTFANAPEEPIMDLSVQRTEDSTVLIINWTFLPDIHNLVHYEVQYRDANQSSINTVFIPPGENQLVIEGLSGVGSYEVRFRAAVQIQRDPLLMSFSPWSAWIPVQGVTTLPPSTPSPTSSSTMTPSIPVVETEGVRSGMSDGLLLVMILVPIVAVIVVGVLVAITTLVTCYRWKKRPQGIYWPAKEEAKLQETPEKQEKHQKPMGSQVFDLQPDSPVDSAFDSTLATLATLTESINQISATPHANSSSLPVSHSIPTTTAPTLAVVSVSMESTSTLDLQPTATMVSMDLDPHPTSTANISMDSIASTPDLKPAIAVNTSVTSLASADFSPIDTPFASGRPGSKSSVATTGENGSVYEKLHPFRV